LFSKLIIIRNAITVKVIIATYNYIMDNVIIYIYCISYVTAMYMWVFKCIVYTM